MRKMRWVGLLGGLLAVLCGLLANEPWKAPAAEPAALRLGLVASLFRDTPRSMIQILAQPLKSLLETQTTMTGRLESCADPLTLGKQLEENRIDLAVLHGFEFGWVRQTYPDLQALVIVSNPQPFQAYLMVARDSNCVGCTDLKGKTLTLPRHSREHLHLFLERCCTCGCKEPADFFGKIRRPADAEDALDIVAEGIGQAALVDYQQLAGYRRAKPENYGKLRVLLKSETFPTGVVAYRSGGLSDEAVQRIRTGLLSGNQTKEGREQLNLCNMTGFDPVPPDFLKSLAAFAKLYPPPSK